MKLYVVMSWLSPLGSEKLDDFASAFGQTANHVSDGAWFETDEETLRGKMRELRVSGTGIEPSHLQKIAHNSSFRFSIFDEQGEDFFPYDKPSQISRFVAGVPSKREWLEKNNYDFSYPVYGEELGSVPNGIYVKSIAMTGDNYHHSVVPEERRNNMSKFHINYRPIKWF